MSGTPDFLADLKTNGLLRTLCSHNPKTFEIRPIRATFSCFAGIKGMFFHASMKHMPLIPWFRLYYANCSK